MNAGVMRSRTLLTLACQVLVGVLLAVGLLFGVPLSGAGQLLLLLLASTLAVWGIGYCVGQDPRTRGNGAAARWLLTTAVGGLLGIWLLTQVSQAGFIGMFALPLLGALFGYYFAFALATPTSA